MRSSHHWTYGLDDQVKRSTPDCVFTISTAFIQSNRLYAVALGSRHRTENRLRSLMSWFECEIHIRYQGYYWGFFYHSKGRTFQFSMPTNLEFCFFVFTIELSTTSASRPGAGRSQFCPRPPMGSFRLPGKHDSGIWNPSRVS